ncbi:MAG: GAF domain-containing protein, partial [Rhodothermales bacterium]
MDTLEAEDKKAIYDEVFLRIEALLAGQNDWVSAMATVACELHHSFDYYHWTGFYRAVSDNLLLVGPYQGGHGCLEISFDRGVCGAAAKTRETQLVPDVNAFPGHIACSSSTLSEIVLPVITPKDRLLAVLDVDSNDPD